MTVDWKSWIDLTFFNLTEQLKLPSLLAKVGDVFVKKMRGSTLPVTAVTTMAQFETGKWPHHNGRQVKISTRRAVLAPGWSLAMR